MMPPTAPSSATGTKLSSERLWLRPYTQEMAPAFWELLHQNRQRLLADFPDRTAAVQSLPDAQNRIRVYHSQFKAGDLYSFGIWRKETEELIGDITLRRLARGKPYAEVGYYLGAQAEGQGYASEALKALIKFSFQELRMESVNLRCAHDNHRSQRVAERCGFTYFKTYMPEEPDSTHTPRRPILVYRLKKEDARAALRW
ncbi:GNAT family N-acetyltransferase [Rufibacter immobilis]|uniref:GNAT family N-acetyltransferase n=1 Tax=Rufibacter immobilis TaxID=1348778 RepID=UPI0035EA7C55